MKYPLIKEGFNGSGFHRQKITSSIYWKKNTFKDLFFSLKFVLI